MVGNKKIRLPDIDIHKRSGSYDTHVVSMKNGKINKVQKLNSSLKANLERKNSKPAIQNVNSI